MLLRAADEHYSLHKPFPNEPSQLRFENNEKSMKCLIYRDRNQPPSLQKPTPKFTETNPQEVLALILAQADQ